MSWLWLLAVALVVAMVHSQAEVPIRSSDGLPPLKAVVEELSRKLPEQEARLTAVEQMCRTAVWNVAFHAHLQDDKVAIFPSGTIIYNVVITNIGNAYDAHTGMFTAPVTGSYSFTITCMAVVGTSVALDLVVNGQAVGTCWSTTTTASVLSSTTTAVHVSAGNKVWVRQATSINQIRGTVWAVFSGFLIQADTSGSPPVNVHSRLFS